MPGIILSAHSSIFCPRVIRLSNVNYFGLPTDLLHMNNNDIAPFLSVDRHGVLKMPGPLWLIILFELRHWLMLVIAGASLRSAPQTAGIFGAIPWYDLAPELPVVALLVAYANRLPDSGAAIRWLWSRGRELITLTALIHVAWAVWVLAGTRYWSPWPERAMAAFALADLLAILAMWRWPLAAQVFREFPPKPDPTQGKQANPVR